MSFLNVTLKLSSANEQAHEQVDNEIRTLIPVCFVRNNVSQLDIPGLSAKEPRGITLLYFTVYLSRFIDNDVKRRYSVLRKCPGSAEGSDVNSLAPHICGPGSILGVVK